MFDDVREAVAVIAGAGAMLGYFLPLYVAGILTLGALILGVYLLWETFTTPQNGTSGGLGAFLIVAGAEFFFLVPLWLTKGAILLWRLKP